MTQTNYRQSSNAQRTKARRNYNTNKYCNLKMFLPILMVLSSFVFTTARNEVGSNLTINIASFASPDVSSNFFMIFWWVNVKMFIVHTPKEWLGETYNVSGFTISTISYFSSKSKFKLLLTPGPQVRWDGKSAASATGTYSRASDESCTTWDRSKSKSIRVSVPSNFSSSKHFFKC